MTVRLHQCGFLFAVSGCLVNSSTNTFAFVPQLAVRPRVVVDTRQWVQTYNVDSAKTDDGDDEEVRKQVTNKYADLYRELMLKDDNDEDSGLLSADEVEEVSTMQERIEKDEKELLELIKQEENLVVPTFPKDNGGSDGLKASVATLEKKAVQKENKKNGSRFSAVLEEEEEEEITPNVLEEVKPIEEEQAIDNVVPKETRKTPIILGAAPSKEFNAETEAEVFENEEETPIILEGSAMGTNNRAFVAGPAATEEEEEVVEMKPEKVPVTESEVVTQPIILEAATDTEEVAAETAQEKEKGPMVEMKPEKVPVSESEVVTQPIILEAATDTDEEAAAGTAQEKEKGPILEAKRAQVVETTSQEESSEESSLDIADVTMDKANEDEAKEDQDNSPIVVEAAPTDSQESVESLPNTKLAKESDEKATASILGSASDLAESIIVGAADDNEVSQSDWTREQESEGSETFMLHTSDASENPLAEATVDKAEVSRETGTVLLGNGATIAEEPEAESTLEESKTAETPVAKITTDKEDALDRDKELKESTAPTLLEAIASDVVGENELEEGLEAFTEEAVAETRTDETAEKSIISTEEKQEVEKSSVLSVDLEPEEALVVPVEKEPIEILPLKKVTVRQPFWAGTTYRDISDTLVEAVTPRDSVDELWSRDGVDLIVKTTAHITNAAVATGKVAFYATAALGEALTDEEVNAFASEASLTKNIPPLRKLEAVGSTCSAAAQCLRSSASTGRAIEAMADTTKSLVSAVASAAVGVFKSATNAKGLLSRIQEQVVETRLQYEQQLREQEKLSKERRALDAKRKLVEEYVQAKQAAAEDSLNKKMEEDMRVKLEQLSQTRHDAKQKALLAIRHNAENEKTELLDSNALSIQVLEDALKTFDAQEVQAGD